MYTPGQKIGNSTNQLPEGRGKEGLNLSSLNQLFCVVAEVCQNLCVLELSANCYLLPPKAATVTFLLCCLCMKSVLPFYSLVLCI